MSPERVVMVLRGLQRARGRLPVGTQSLLWGVHQVLWHPWTVWRAWRALYGAAPNWRECVCIVVHDWGYWGCEAMDGSDGLLHPVRGARVAGWLFGFDHYKLVLDHSRFLCARCGRVPSRLCWADKFSLLFEPAWFYLLRARLSGELREYRELAAERGFIGREASDRAWFEQLRAQMRVMAQEMATQSTKGAK